MQPPKTPEPVTPPWKPSTISTQCQGDRVQHTEREMRDMYFWQRNAEIEKALMSGEWPLVIYLNCNSAQERQVGVRGIPD
mmetsp:Transcript_8809/g.13999  ORF Transcript_8809/g.13999 Transcript_8809/m.13999 type:complete len:80 (-) Transcript_8809:6-245(-)